MSVKNKRTWAMRRTQKGKKEKSAAATGEISGREWAWMLGQNALLAAVLAWLFYDSAYAWPPLVLLTLFMLKGQKKKLLEKKQAALAVQFREGLLAVSAALGAGYSVENAFREALYDLQILYPAGSRILVEFQRIVSGIEMNRSIEQLLYAFAERSRLPDAQMFAEVFDVCKRTGGDVTSVIADTASRISDQIDVNREIRTFLSARRLEQHIMDVVPLAIILYVRLASPDFLAGIYRTVAGILLMTVCLCIYGGAYLLSERILRIPL